jgi:hypothetical protein
VKRIHRSSASVCVVCSCSCLLYVKSSFHTTHFLIEIGYKNPDLQRY